MMIRHVIVNADDLGLSPGINRGIAEAHEHGVVTSASLMVLQPAAEEAAEWAGGRSLSIGIHLDLCEWVYRDGEWSALYSRVDTDDQIAVEEEIDRQLARFVQLVGHLPSHIDSHQHVHRSGAVAAAVERCNRELHLPVRGRSTVVFCGDFHGQDTKGGTYPHLISPAALATLLSRTEAGWTEISCHPGFAEDTDSTYRLERRQEVATLCDSAVRKAIEDDHIQLSTFLEVPGARAYASAVHSIGGDQA